MRVAILAATVVTAAVFLGSIRPVAAGPWRTMLNIHHVEADENKPYWLTEENGPWCILATSFAGKGAQRDAHRLVIELRKRYGLEAYMHQRTYDYSETVPGLGVDKYGAPKKMRYLQGGRYDEVAVLVGNFADVTDAAVEKTLDKIKYAQPACLKLDGNRQVTQRFAGLRTLQRVVNRNEEKRRKGPMGSAFVSRNPLLPDEFFAPSGVDKFVLDMNKDVEHSLLDCPGKYSVRVATFRGNVILDQAEIHQIEQRGGNMKTRLDDAAMKAHKLTVALRKQGVEAYEFHDRYESVVAVGSFDVLTLPYKNAEGRTEINVAVAKVMKAYGAEQVQLPGGRTSPGLRPKSLAGVPFDIQPVPVEVPRRSIAADYARRR